MGAVLIATLATAVLFQARPGLNVPLVVFAITGFAWHLEARRGGPARHTRILDALLLGLASCFAVSNDGGMLFPVVLLGLWLGSITVLGSVAVASAMSLAGAPLFALFSVLGRSGREVNSALNTLRGGRHAQILRGLAFAMPTVAVFFLLLAQADSTLEIWRTTILDTLHSLSFLPQGVFWTLCCALLLGRLALAAQPQSRAVPAHSFTVLPRASVTERGIVLGGVDALFGLFLVLQLPRLFTDSGALVGSGVTYAEAIHRGFGEITCVVSLAALLVCTLDRFALRGQHEQRVRQLTGVLIAESLMMLASAAFRLIAYQEAYGYSVLRVYVQVYLGLAALGLVLLARETMGVVQPRRLFIRCASAAILAVMGLAYVNVPAWVAAHNVELRVEGRDLDVPYLTLSLGADAIPTVERALPRLGAADRQRILCQYLQNESSRQWRSAPADRWFEWNLRRMSARTSLERMAAVAPACPPEPEGY